VPDFPRLHTSLKLELAERKMRLAEQVLILLALLVQKYKY